MRQVGSDDAADAERFVGSPTIRIDGVDCSTPATSRLGLTCRVYYLRDGRVSAVPDPDDLRDALRRAHHTQRSSA